MASYALIAGAAIFLLTYALISVPRIGRTRLDRPAVAMLGAALMLLFGVIGPTEALASIDLGLIVLLIGMMLLVSGLSALLSNLISNVPAVLLLSEVVQGSGGSRLLWLALASSSTLAGNATILGAAANVIVVQVASRDGVEVSMKEFVKAGLPATEATLLVSTVLLAVLVPA